VGDIHDELDILRLPPIFQIPQIIQELRFGEIALERKFLEVERVRQTLYELLVSASCHAIVGGREGRKNGGMGKTHFELGLEADQVGLPFGRAERGFGSVKEGRWGQDRGQLLHDDTAVE